jgi:hypothetical protein
METLGNENLQKTCKNFYCNLCDYKTYRKSSYVEHLNTSKHKKLTNGNILETYGNTKPAELDSIKHTCQKCLKDFKNRSGLWKHKKKCIDETDSNYDSETESNSVPLEKELIMMLIKQNTELLEIVKNGTHNTTNNTNNSHNKTFNLNMFLYLLTFQTPIIS